MSDYDSWKLDNGYDEDEREERRISRDEARRGREEADRDPLDDPELDAGPIYPDPDTDFQRTINRIVTGSLKAVRP
jgi:hypothetical protein